MSIFHSQLEPDGRIKIPPQILEELNLEAGNDLDLELEDHQLRVSLSQRERIRRIQETMRKYIEPGVSIVDELIADRRREAENE